MTEREMMLIAMSMIDEVVFKYVAEIPFGERVTRSEAFDLLQKAISSLWENGKECDLLSVVDELKDQGVYEKIGGLDTLNSVLKLAWDQMGEMKAKARRGLVN